MFDAKAFLPQLVDFQLKQQKWLCSLHEYIFSSPLVSTSRVAAKRNDEAFFHGGNRAGNGDLTCSRLTGEYVILERSDDSVGTVQGRECLKCGAGALKSPA